MQNSSGTALNLFVNNDTEKNATTLSFNESRLCLSKRKKKGGERSFCSTHYTWELIREAKVCVRLQMQRQFSLIWLYPSLWEVTWSFKRSQFVFFSGDCTKPMWHLPTALHSVWLLEHYKSLSWTAYWSEHTVIGFNTNFHFFSKLGGIKPHTTN